jgi:hypothetical protein
VAGQPLDELAAARVDEGEEAVVPADDEQPVARHIPHSRDRPCRDHAERR